jgi:DNA-binding NarL/FixJ family response regulator
MRGHPDMEFMLRRQHRLSESDRDLAYRASGPIRVLFAESSRMVAEALMLAIDLESSLEPIGYALEGWEALELVESLRPDVVVVGPRLPGLDGLTLNRLLNELWPPVRVVLLTDSQVPDATDAVEYLPLDRSADELIETITAASASRPRLAAVGSYAQLEAIDV